MTNDKLLSFYGSNLHASTPPAVQSTPVCRLQGSAGAAGGGGGGGGGLLADEEDTEDEEEGGSDEDGGSDREGRPQPEEEEEQGGEAKDLGASSGGRGLMLAVGRGMVRPVPCGVDKLVGLDGGSVGLV